MVLLLLLEEKSFSFHKLSHWRTGDVRAVYLNIQTLYPFQTLQVFAIVLVLAGIVLIFFLTEAGVGMCFGFVVKTELLSSSLSSACTASRPFLLLTSVQQWQGCECRRGWEGMQLEQLIPADPRDMPQHMVSCSAYRAGARRRKRWGRCS